MTRPRRGSSGSGRHGSQPPRHTRSRQQQPHNGAEDAGGNVEAKGLTRGCMEPCPRPWQRQEAEMGPASLTAGRRCKELSEHSTIQCFETAGAVWWKAAQEHANGLLALHPGCRPSRQQGKQNERQGHRQGRVGHTTRQWRRGRRGRQLMHGERRAAAPGP